MIGDDRDEEAALRHEGERIAQLVDDLGEIGGAPVQQRLEELVQRLLHLYGAAFARLLLILGGDQPDAATRARLHADPLVSSLLVLHGIHPVPEAARDFDPAHEEPRPAPASGLVQIDVRRHAPKAKPGGDP